MFITALIRCTQTTIFCHVKGTILIECGKLLDKGGYRIKVLNTIMVNTKGEGEKSSKDFWTKAEKLYYTALISYIYYEAPEEAERESCQS